MTSKTIMIGLVAIAFVAGSIMTGTMASAQKGGVGDNLIVDALNSIATAISGIEPTVNVDPTPITVNAPQGEQGIQGEQGTQGEQGPAGTIKTYFVRETTDGNVQTFNAHILCDEGDVPLGGGVGHSSNFAVVVRSDNLFIPEGSTIPTGWRVIVASEDNSFFSASGDVICLDNTPFRSSLPPIVVIP